MDVITGTCEFKIPENTVVSIGKFDGVHKGHIQIIKRMREYISRGYKLCVLTFDIPPSSLGFGIDNGVILSNEEKRYIFSDIGIDYYIEFPFYEKTASIPARQFIEEYIVDRMNAKAVVVGEDCTFGQGAEGNAQMLRDFGPIYDYEVEIISKIKDGKHEISSTYLKELLAAGNVKKFMNLAYYPFYVHGRFKRDSISVGGGMSYYVMDVSEEKVIPRDGVYYSTVIYEDELYDALKNGDIRSACFDVFTREPQSKNFNPEDFKLLTLDNFELTPHTAARTNEADVRTCQMSSEIIIEHLRAL